MVHEIHLCKLKPSANEETIETMMVEARIRLLKIPEVLNLSCGKWINRTDHDYPFYFALDFENMAKRQMAHNTGAYIKFEAQVIKSHVSKMEVLLFEMEPCKDVAYS
ncbi:MAG: Dabb family protein [Candidatus Methylacidiphilales bacterium]